MIAEVVDYNPAMPIHWGMNQKGMQANQQLDPDDIADCKGLWTAVRDDAIYKVKILTSTYRLHKQVANRLLEPWTHMTTLVSATDWENFFALRVHPDAQPEFQALAVSHLEAMIASTPKEVNQGDWHLPFADKYLKDNCQDEEELRKACIGRCARVSYKNQNGEYSLQADLELFERIAKHEPLHATPMEHVAQARKTSSRSGNFRGWTQFRKQQANECVKVLDFKEHLAWYRKQLS
jgi:hypothetical protein